MRAPKENPPLPLSRTIHVALNQNPRQSLQQSPRRSTTVPNIVPIYPILKKVPLKVQIKTLLKVPAKVLKLICILWLMIIEIQDDHFQHMTPSPHSKVHQWGFLKGDKIEVHFHVGRRVCKVERNYTKINI